MEDIIKNKISCNINAKHIITFFNNFSTTAFQQPYSFVHILFFIC